MIHPIGSTSVICRTGQKPHIWGLARRPLTLVTAALLGVLMSAVAATPGLAAPGLAAPMLAAPVVAAQNANTGQAQASVGYVRLAHLSPDTPEVDVYLAKMGDASFTEQVFKHVGYGVMSKYLPLPLGTYAVAMRQQGAPATSPPVLTTQVTVDPGGAYTVAGVGRFANLGLQVLVDDLSRPDTGKSKVRVIQASVAAPVMDVSLANGTPIANSVPFASTTAYQLVNPGTWTLKLKPNGSTATSTVSAYLVGGSVYSLLVLDSDHGLKAELRTDARGGELAPDGGVETGTASASSINPLTTIGIGVGIFAALVLVVVGLRMRRLASRRA